MTISGCKQSLTIFSFETNASKKSAGRKIIIFTQSIECLTSAVEILAKKAMFIYMMCLQTNLQTMKYCDKTDSFFKKH